MIDRELRGRHRLAAVLAGPVVAQQEISSIGAQHAARDLDVGQEPDDDHVFTEAAAGHRLFHSRPCLVIDEGHPLFGQQDDQPPLTDHVQRLKRGV